MSKQVRSKYVTIIKNLLQRKQRRNPRFRNTKQRHQVRLQKRFQTQSNQIRTENPDIRTHTNISPVSQEPPGSNGSLRKKRMRRLCHQHQPTVSRQREPFNHDQFTFIPTAQNRLPLSKRFRSPHTLESPYSPKKSLRNSNCPAPQRHNLSRTVNRDKEIPGKLLKSVQNAHDHKKRTDADDDPSKTDSRNNINNPKTLAGKAETPGNPETSFHTTKKKSMQFNRSALSMRVTHRLASI